ncbi:putative membrane protein [Yersinia pestis PY-66]|uniref:Uncharacterized protein n=1 Tax=Yersinia pestis biovar Orientalis str. IP275 TaxID=373665 RepID=A0AAV3BK34_YERPE|nr:hypothetical protein YpAngola_A1173 [Yersinia pestis Angola]EDR33281.1 hypothetical protein YPIP275_0267 [Yersinia pestis biovar Orientalis str. IP275]EDR37014.1 hypothetical protein YpF1991016_3574 [Yersinia pestis biovar Orientalis str. F1991016]EDR42029.1 hypothetical protein YpE1979001_4535 [Yersinia pestis biovar Antiqua str. E1979001]EDR51225.1 hypothetical protein YpB42003004_4064 [Yersinia pestis biovar Antiqua str. B42003004]EDR57543.1 hypothetical protein YpMG051020_4125 [Yersinia
MVLMALIVGMILIVGTILRATMSSTAVVGSLGIKGIHE